MKASSQLNILVGLYLILAVFWVVPLIFIGAWKQAILGVIWAGLSIWLLYGSGVARSLLALLGSVTIVSSALFIAYSESIFQWKL